MLWWIQRSTTLFYSDMLHSGVTLRIMKPKNTYYTNKTITEPFILSSSYVAEINLTEIFLVVT